MPGAPSVVGGGDRWGSTRVGRARESWAAGRTALLRLPGPEPAVSYPEGEFMINKTRVVYARGGSIAAGDRRPV